MASHKALAKLSNSEKIKRVKQRRIYLRELRKVKRLEKLKQLQEVVIHSNNGKELFLEIFRKTNSYIKTKEILQKQYNILITLEVSYVYL